MNLSHVVSSPLLADPQPFTIIRSEGGTFGPGGFENRTKQMPARGVVTVATERELMQVPEGDRPKAAMIFASRTQMFTTRAGAQQGISDVLVWEGQQWSVIQTGNYRTRGFFTAVATRLNTATIQE